MRNICVNGAQILLKVHLFQKGKSVIMQIDFEEVKMYK